MSSTVHVMLGLFSSVDEAMAYTTPRWEPEPDDQASDEQYAAWEDRNPIWPMRDEMGIYLDSDFIETIDGPERYSYLADVLGDKRKAAEIEAAAPGSANVIVLIFSMALGGFTSAVRPVGKLSYVGEYPWSP